MIKYTIYTIFYIRFIKLILLSLFYHPINFTLFSLFIYYKIKTKIKNTNQTIILTNQN